MMKTTEDKDKDKSKFKSTASLSKVQRKYCDCVMKVRSSGKSKKSTKKWTNSTPYAICYSTLRKSRNLDKTKKTKKKFHNILKPQSINCLMSYDTDKYTLEDIQKLAKEKGIITTFLKDKRRFSYKKSTLITKLTKNYTKNLSNKSKNNKKSK